ncbi:carbohydrate kinase family protein [Fimbriimonadia bacterium ATM]|nr:MAG: carbohydrate kinase family protein [Armatimonadota bacterium]MBC6970674.1 carbohydrate kinase family protein [Armatimonadota bacterium]MCE7899619.1 carbohydrate kinase family protein [Armatimonadetes bacterium ATM1]MDL1927704.1 carbohydrate kinase family protein [Fimbriimonadia bacterium ATM]RIJ95392.1 MAG: hypothetical protein DCC45_10615 [Armatimonadota bacterium]
MICVYGTVCLDEYVVVPRIPEPGLYVAADSRDFHLGGEAANTAIALMRLGVPVTLVGNPVGLDLDGARLQSLLEQNGLPPAKVDENIATPTCIILVTPDGERTMIGSGFTKEAGSKTSLANLKGCSWFTAEPNFGEVARSAVEQVQATGVSTYLMDFVGERYDSVVRDCDVLQTSTDVVGRKGDSSINADWAKNHADEMQCSTILTDGVHGVHYCEPGEAPIHYPAYPLPDHFDSTGAGDCFRAGVLYALHRGLDLRESIPFGSAAGALACRSMGATTSAPTEDELHEFMTRNGRDHTAYA